MTQSRISCPACGKEAELLLKWPFSGLDNSVFNYTAEFAACPHCGLLHIANINDTQLARFYREECLYSENQHFDIHSESNIAKYRHYRSVLEREGLKDAAIADVGCGRGGFMIWMKQHGWQGDCTGVDVDVTSMALHDSEHGGAAFYEGSAVSLPFTDGSRSCLSYFHVVEHIRDIDRLLGEAARVLNDDGALMIEVPDATRYAAYPMGTAFWLAIREHVYHFTPQAFQAALARFGFGVSQVVQSELSTPEFDYPSLIVVARKGRTSAVSAGLQPQADTVADYALDARRQMTALTADVEAFASDGGAITFWGCSSVMYSLLPLMDRQRIRLCDASPSKQRSLWQGIPILAPEAAEPEGRLVVSSFLHREAITEAALRQGWPETSIMVLK
ncbi:Methyltransferase domain-containing protein [Mariprofundus aestuarium]|uniref:Methyltransferase domain-containing protein n=1 Tax=Mariprofundus aestuarium TaxID=1921086 RepID=A0A2K8KV45_MARES|nr:class I SAM-dependent methyltransferase [Mariprofundus aestuarium]ATX78637.1 Methyltransferase domain-containing protein [Mariprofundus aestuarium]